MKHVGISSIINRKGRYGNLIRKVNGLLREMSRECDMYFLDNDDIIEHYLASDGLHLNWKGTAKFANNFLNSLNSA